MAEIFTSENWVDIREAVQRRLKEVNAAEVVTAEARSEKARRVNSLNESLKKIEQILPTTYLDNKQILY